ncbi:hypothetical protein KKC1_34960 [Calderihabitans maritimus]|uniref:Uncharacterized protein n=1 Tax=Calderihabitans maritimus TaxID=1246530 RepID=A0A1Z5HYI0_9FIRM|nr:hypothetical protein KKC1_34960 [Calderihabitans maritimus]
MYIKLGTVLDLNGLLAARGKIRRGILIKGGAYNIIKMQMQITCN